MAWNRREFLQLMMGAGVVHTTGFPHSIIGSESEKKGFSILQGMTDETSAQFSLILPKGQQWRLEVDDKNVNLGEIAVHSRTYSEHAVYKVTVDGLELGRRYRLSVLDAQGKKHDEREFRALDLSRRQARIGFVSCALDLLHHDDVWNKLSDRDPEMLFFLGDNVYADRTSLINKEPADPEQLWTRFMATRNRVAFYYQKKLRPVLAIWDDHDFGADNADRTYPYKEESRENFEIFFAQEARPALLAGPGIAKRFSAFGADFFLFDGRTYRDVKDTSGAKMFGATQEKWLFPNINPRAAWLLSGSMFHGAYAERESFEGVYDNDFNNFCARLKSAGGLYCFGSGDIHYSEIMDIEKARLGYQTFEMVSSSIHSFTFPGSEYRYSNPRRRVASSAHNFVIFEGLFGEDSIEGDLTSYSSSSTEFRVPVRVKR